MSSVSSLGGDTAQRWQALKESRANQTADSGAANRPRPLRGPPAAGSADPSGNPAAASSISSASAKVITDLKALFIDLQSGTPVASVASATAAGTNNATSVQSDLKTLAGDLGKVGGHHGGHHSHHAPPTDASSTDPTADATTSLAAGSTPAGQPASKPAGGLLDQLVGALKAYAASSNDNSAAAASSLSA